MGIEGTASSTIKEDDVGANPSAPGTTASNVNISNTNAHVNDADSDSAGEQPGNVIVRPQPSALAADGVGNSQNIVGWPDAPSTTTGVDTLGLDLNDRPALGGAAFDSTSVAVSAITLVRPQQSALAADGSEKSKNIVGGHDTPSTTDVTPSVSTGDNTDTGVDTLGLDLNDRPALGGVVFDSTSVAVSAITQEPYVAPTGLGASGRFDGRAFGGRGNAVIAADTTGGYNMEYSAAAAAQCGSEESSNYAIAKAAPPAAKMPSKYEMADQETSDYPSKKPPAAMPSKDEMADQETSDYPSKKPPPEIGGSIPKGKNSTALLGEGDDPDDSQALQESNIATTPTPPSRPSDADSNSATPGAFRVYPGGSQTQVPPRSETTDEESPGANLEGEVDAECQRLEHSNHVAAEAYLVDPTNDPPRASVVHTYFGIERKRLILLSSLGLGIFAIVLATVLGILLPRANKKEDNDQEVCGPLCGPDTAIPDPKLEVYGQPCESWDFNSTFLPAPRGLDGTCSDVYQTSAYGCGCPGVDIPPSGCGKLCRDGSDLPDPSLMVKDIHNSELSCQDWELMSQFDSDPNECVNYNAIGALCGCSNNEPHPDACGPLCGGADFRHSGLHHVWEMTCDNWNILSIYLPSWYNNEGNETCAEYYNDVYHGCACPDVSHIRSDCGALCQDRRVCSPICQNRENEVPDSKLIVRRETCEAWEMHSRLEVHSIVCPFYHMTGSQCGCEDNAPPQDACGPLCGTDGILPDPTREVHGESCQSWDFMSRFLSEEYGKGTDRSGGIIESCSKHFSGAAYGCGCSGIEPPSNGCGTLCADGKPVPFPDRVVNARTCKDLELLSLFETDSKQCSRQKIFGELCGCPRPDEYDEECFEMGHLKTKTYYFSAGGSLYSISFGDNGYFAQIQGNGDLFMMGRLNDMNEDNTAIYGGGTPCGLYGPRSGSVAIVEDETVTDPEISYIIEPSICVYQAELRVPAFCQNQTKTP